MFWKVSLEDMRPRSCGEGSDERGGLDWWNETEEPYFRSYMQHPEGRDGRAEIAAQSH
jgi:hypothetical protein